MDKGAVKITRHSTIVKYLIYYSLVLLLPLTAMTISYFEILGIVKRDTFQAQLSVLKQSSDVFDQSLIDMEALAVNLKTNLSVNRFFQVRNPLDDPGSVVDITQIRSDLAEYATTNDFYNLIAVYSGSSQLMITNKATVIRLEQYYDLFRISDLSYTQWRDEFLGGSYERTYLYHVPVQSNGIESYYIVYANSLPWPGSSNTANIFVFIDEEKVLDLFDTLNETGERWFYISDRNNRLVVGNQLPGEDVVSRINGRIGDSAGYFVDDTGGREMFVTYVRGESSGLYYVSALSVAEIRKKTDSIRLILGSLIILTVLIGMIMVITLSLQSVKPVKKIISLLSQGQSRCKGNDFDFINAELFKMINSNQKLKKQLQDQDANQRLSIFHRLLNGEISDPDELRSVMGQYEINLNAHYYAVLIITINDVSADTTIDALSACKILLNNMIREHIKGVLVIYDTDFNREAVIVATERSDCVGFMDSLNDGAVKIYERLQRDSGIYVSFSGSLSQDLLHTNRAYYEAGLALQYQNADRHSKIIWYKKGVKKSELFFHYSMEQENQLLTGILNGQGREVRELMSHLHRANFVHNKLPCALQKQLLQSIFTTVYRAAEKLPEQREWISREIEQIQAGPLYAADLNADFERLRHFVLELCAGVRDQKICQSASLIQRITLHIDEQYQDSQISLASVADAFGITEVYLSQFFKQQTGMNFSKYIEKLRMEEAESLLKCGQYKVSEIAEKVGYNSPQVFRRVYKRFFGHSTTERVRQ